MLLSASSTPTLPATDRSVRIQVFRTSVCPHEARSDVTGLQTPPSFSYSEPSLAPVAACNFHEENAKPGRDTHGDGDRRATAQAAPESEQTRARQGVCPALSRSASAGRLSSKATHRPNNLNGSIQTFRGFLLWEICLWHISKW